MNMKDYPTLHLDTNYSNSSFIAVLHFTVAIGYKLILVTWNCYYNLCLSVMLDSLSYSSIYIHMLSFLNMYLNIFFIYDRHNHNVIKNYNNKNSYK
jgi:hypothetical protein